MDLDFTGMTNIISDNRRVLLVFDTFDQMTGFMDSFYEAMVEAELGNCDCGKVYGLARVDDHCGVCGSCFDHCECETPNSHITKFESICDCGHYESDHDGYGCLRISCICARTYVK